MHKNYYMAIDTLKETMKAIERLTEDAPIDSFEDCKACSILLKLKDRIESSVEQMRHFTRITHLGILEELDDGGLQLNAYKYYPLNPGDRLEILYNGKWYSGGIEYKDGKYYFCNGDLLDPCLCSGMKARIRD